MKFPTSLLFIVATMLAYGCDGQTDGLSGVDTAGEGLNGILTGKIITTYQFKPYEFDLSTGTSRELPLLSNIGYLDSLNDGETHDEYNYFSANGSSVNQGYVETSYSCYRVPQRSCLTVYNRSFQAVKRIVAERTLQSPAKLSDSGQLVVMSDMDAWFNESSSILIMDVASGNVTDSIDIDHELEDRGNLPGHPVVEWGMNDEVIFSVPADDRPTVYVTRPGTTDIDRTIRLPSAYTGIITTLDLHPDGTQLLLGYEGNPESQFNRNGLAIVLDLDDLSIRIPAVNQADADRIPIGENFVSQYVNPMWSPDGRQIMLLNLAAFDGGVANPDVALSNNLVVLPADSDHVIVNTSNATYESPVSVIKLADPLNSGRLSTQWRGDTFKGGFISWIQ